MFKFKLLFWLVMVLMAVSACGGSAPLALSPSAPASDAPDPQAPPQVPPAEPAAPSPQPLAPVAAPSASGLNVAYLNFGDLWLWNASGARQLTSGGGVSAIAISKDAALLAFLRGGELRLLRADGSDERVLAVLPGEGAGMQFSPNGAWLAVSLPDHIEVYDLAAGTGASVLTYPPIPGYIPQLVWALDSYGFKTVIPSTTEGGAAQLHYVFPAGMVANLGSLELAPLSESQPLISPDGGYIIYTARTGGAGRSLYLMDASGAARPYGESAARIRALGWLPDSRHFTYFSEGSPTSGLLTGSVDSPPQAGAPFDPFVGRWLDAQRFLLLENGSLTLADLGGARLLIAASVEAYAFSTP